MGLTSDETVEVLRAAGEPTRLRILALLAAEELAVMELSRILDQSQPRVSRHLKLLTEAGLVERFPDGAWVFYRLATDGDHRRLVDAVLDLLGDDRPAGPRLPSGWPTCGPSGQAAALAYFAAHRAALGRDPLALRARGRGGGRDPEGRRARARSSGWWTWAPASGRMLTLLRPRRPKSAVGLDLSQQMLNIARANVARAGLDECELRHGDIFSTRLPTGDGRPRASSTRCCTTWATRRRRWPRRRGWSRRAGGC